MKINTLTTRLLSIECSAKGLNVRCCKKSKYRNGAVHAGSHSIQGHMQFGDHWPRWIHLFFEPVCSNISGIFVFAYYCDQFLIILVIKSCVENSTSNTYFIPDAIGVRMIRVEMYRRKSNICTTSWIVYLVGDL